MRRDSPLTDRKQIVLEDLWDQPLLVSRSELKRRQEENDLGIPAEHFQVAATYSLLYNASLMVEEGLGLAICFDGIVNTTGNEHLTFVPFHESLQPQGYVFWKKYQIFNKASEALLEQMKHDFSSQTVS